MKIQSAISPLAFALSAAFCHADALPLTDSILEIHNSFRYYNSQTLVLLRSDGTFQYLVDRTIRCSPPYLPPASCSQTLGHLYSGPYTLSIVQTPSRILTEGTISLEERPSGRTVRNLRFRTEYDGGTGGSAGFRFFPRTDADDLQNVSNRAWVSPGRPAISGFILDKRRFVLIRCAGPALEFFGVSDPLPEPHLVLYRGGSVKGRIGPWSEIEMETVGLKAAFEVVSAFPFADDSKDCARLYTLYPGEYTLHAYSESESGEVLTEVYILPYRIPD